MSAARLSARGGTQGGLSVSRFSRYARMALLKVYSKVPAANMSILSVRAISRASRMAGPSSLVMISQRIRALGREERAENVGEARMKALRSASVLVAQRMTVKQSVFSASSGQGACGKRGDCVVPTSASSAGCVQAIAAL